MNKIVATVGIVVGVAVFATLIDFTVNKNAYLKEACIQAGGTAMEQPAGNYIKCLK